MINLSLPPSLLPQERTIVSVSDDGHTVTLNEPLSATHHGITDIYEDGNFIDIRSVHSNANSCACTCTYVLFPFSFPFPIFHSRAEVGLLTHNVVVQGTRLEDPTGYEPPGEDQYGSQIFIHRMGPHPTPIRSETN